MDQDLRTDNLEKLFRNSHMMLQRRRRRGMVLAGITGFTVALVVFVLLEQVLFLSPAVKTGFWLAAVAAGTGAAWTVRKRVVIPPFTAFYRKFSDDIGLPGIRHILDLSHSGHLFDTELTKAAIQQNLKQIASQEPEHKLGACCRRHAASAVQRYASLAAASGAILLAGIVLWSGDALHRSGTFWISYERPIPFEFTVTPGDTTIAQGSTFQVGVRFRGTVPDQVRLGMRSLRESEPHIQGMRRYDNQIFFSRETELFEDAEFFVVMDGYRTERQWIRVEPLPRLQELTVSVVPPPYTGLDPETYTYPFNRVNARVGSALEIQARTNKPLKKLSMIGGKRGDTLAITPDTLITRHLRARTDEQYHFRMRDHFGLENSNPFRFHLSVSPDQPPHVEILSPERHITDYVTGDLPLLYEFEDDFGFTSVRLRYRLHKAFVNEPLEGTVDLAVPERRRGLAEYDWNIRPMDLSAMDRMEYWIEMTDNNAVDGYQTGRSSIHTIEIPSLAARFFDQDEQEEQMEDRFSEIEESYRRMQQEVERLREEIRTRPDEEWEHTQLIEDISDQRRNIEQQMDDLRRDFDALTRDMEEQGLMSEDTMERYRELQQLMSEIDDPEILKLLEQMQENISQMDQSQLREQLDQIQFNEERYRERLERTLELFKSLRLDADLDRMSKVLEDMAAREGALSEQEAFGEEQVRQQEQIREQMQDLADQLRELPDKSPERRMEQMQQMSDELRREMEQMDQRLLDNIEQMQNGQTDPSEIRQQQQDMGSQMREMAQSLSQMRSRMQQETISVNMRALRYILDTLILLSVEQEDVAQRTGDLASNSPGFIEQARRQRNIAGQFRMITDSLYRVSSEIPQFSNIINDRKHEVQRNMQRSLASLIERDRQQAVSRERTALGGLNEIGTLLADLLDQLSDMENGGGGEGGMSMEQMMQQLQDMSQGQQELNQQILDFINDIQGERLTQDHMERLEQMARQQNEIREQMRQIHRRGGREGDRLMSEMQRLAEQMEEAINDLRGGSTDEMMVERQQNILSRMLEVENSVHKRDEDEEQRLGETAGEFERREVPEMTMEELRQRIRSGVDQTRYTRFREDYRRLIERYFELMEEALEEPEVRSRR